MVPFASSDPASMPFGMARGVSTGNLSCGGGRFAMARWISVSFANLVESARARRSASYAMRGRGRTIAVSATGAVAPGMNRAKRYSESTATEYVSAPACSESRPNWPATSIVVPDPRSVPRSTFAMPFANRARKNAESTPMVSMDDGPNANSRSEYMVAGRNPRPRARPPPFSDVTGPNSITQLRSRRLVSISTSYPSSLERKSTVPFMPNSPPPGSVSRVSTFSASIGPCACRGPCAIPLSGSLGANFVSSASAIGRASTSRSSVCRPVVCTDAEPTACEMLRPSWCTMSRCDATSCSAPEPLSVALPLNVPPIGSRGNNSFTMSIWSGARRTCRSRALTTTGLVGVNPTTPFATTRLVPRP